MLELNIIDGLSIDNPTEKVKSFNDEGGIIGRDVKADWTLYDPSKVISSQHVKVIFSQGSYYFSDLSTNGVVADNGHKLRKGEYRRLKLGETYRIGSYQIEVTGLNTQDQAASFKEAGLGHILHEDKPEESVSPLQYVEKEQDPLAEKANQNIPFKQKPDTLKAFDFMPDPIDFGTPSAANKTNSGKADVSIPDLDFLNELKSTVKTESPSLAVKATEQPQALTDINHEAAPVCADSNFQADFCKLFNLDPKHFTEIDSQQFEKTVKSLFAAMAEKV